MHLDSLTVVELHKLGSTYAPVAPFVIVSHRLDELVLLFKAMAVPLVKFYPN